MKWFNKNYAIELQDNAQTLEEANARFEYSCSICPKAGYCIEEKCYLAQVHQAKVAAFEAQELLKHCNVTVTMKQTRKYDRKGVILRLLTNATKRVQAYSQELALDDASVYVEMGDYQSAYRTLKRNGLTDEAEGLKKALKGGD